MRKIIMVVVLLAVAACGGCVKDWDMNVGNGMFAWKFNSVPATSYRIGSYEDVNGKAFDLLYFDALPEVKPPTAEELASEIEIRLAELERAAAALAVEVEEEPE